jgi:hypothetical protein
MCAAVAILIISGCMIDPDNPRGLGKDTGDQMSQDVNELKGPHYAKLNSIGCLYYDDLMTAKKGDFDTIDQMIRDKRCFVLPTDTDIYIKERVQGDVVSAKLKGSTQLFYTVRTNLVAE